MEITIFKASRTVAREYAKTVNGKVKDMGSAANSGERWAVMFTAPDDVQVPDAALVGKSQAVKDMAERHGLEVVDITPAKVDSAEDLKGLPVSDAEARLDFDLPEGAVIVAATHDKPHNRKVLKMKVKTKGRQNLNKGTMKNRKGQLIDVMFKRSKIYNAMNG